MYLRLIIFLFTLISFELNAQHLEKKPDISIKKIIKIETKTTSIINYKQDGESGKKRIRHDIKLYTPEGEVLEERFFSGDGSLRDSIRYEFDDSGREVKSVTKRGYSTKEYIGDRLHIEREFKGHRRHLLEKRVYEYPKNNRTNIVIWSNENKITGKEEFYFKDGQIAKVVVYKDEKLIQSLEVIRNEYGNIISVKNFDADADATFEFEYDIKYDENKNYTHIKRKQNGQFDGWSVRRTIQYEDTLLPDFCDTDLMGTWISSNERDSIIIDIEKMYISHGVFKWRLKGKWGYDPIGNMLKVYSDSKYNDHNRGSRNNRWSCYYFLLNDDQLSISLYKYHGERVKHFRKISD